MTEIAIGPDLAAIKQRQQATWASGDYHMIGTQIQIVSELLIEALDVHSTERVLDVATGSGNAALAAARRGCSVVGLDYVPALLERARRRADAEGAGGGVRRRRRRGPAVRGRSFDVVTLGLRAMFAPDQEQTASELARVTRSRRPDRRGRPHAGWLHRSSVQDDRARTCRRRPGCARRSSGAPRSAFGSSSATRSPRSAPRSATTSSGIDLAGGLHRVLAALVRSDAEGIRRRRRGRARGARARPPRPHRPVQPGRRRHDGRAERVPRGSHRQALGPNTAAASAHSGGAAFDYPASSGSFSSRYLTSGHAPGDVLEMTVYIRPDGRS